VMTTRRMKLDVVVEVDDMRVMVKQADASPPSRPWS
jgi:hypothetical protein